MKRGFWLLLVFPILSTGCMTWNPQAHTMDRMFKARGVCAQPVLVEAPAPIVMVPAGTPMIPMEMAPPPPPERKMHPLNPCRLFHPRRATQ